MFFWCRRFKIDVPTSAMKAAPDFCNVFVISKGKISSKRNASRSAPVTSPLLHQLEFKKDHSESQANNNRSLRGLFLQIMNFFFIMKKAFSLNFWQFSGNILINLIFCRQNTRQASYIAWRVCQVTLIN